jgi:hypothetical protein
MVGSWKPEEEDPATGTGLGSIQIIEKTPGNMRPMFSCIGHASRVLNGAVIAANSKHRLLSNSRQCPSQKQTASLPATSKDSSRFSSDPNLNVETTSSASAKPLAEPTEKLRLSVELDEPNVNLGMSSISAGRLLFGGEKKEGVGGGSGSGTEALVTGNENMKPLLVLLSKTIAAGAVAEAVFEGCCELVISATSGLATWLWIFGGDSSRLELLGGS